MQTECSSKQLKSIIMKLIPYVLFAGNAEEALNFYKQAINAEVQMLSRFGDSPMPGDEDWKNKIMHSRLVIGDDTLFMISDSMKGSEFSSKGNIELSIGLEDEAQTRELFTKLSEGGTVTMPLAPQFWGDLFGMFTDKFGVRWMINCTIKK
jgi:PhnB protein